MMTVAELIEKLKGCPDQSAPVGADHDVIYVFRDDESGEDNYPFYV